MKGNRLPEIDFSWCTKFNAIEQTKYGSKYSVSDLVDTPLAHCSRTVITAEYSRRRDVTIYNCSTMAKQLTRARTKTSI